MANEIRSLILGLPAVPDPSNSPEWAEWIHPEFSVGYAPPAEAAARSFLLGSPTTREGAEFAATVLCRAAMDLDLCRAALARTFGRISFCFDLRSRLVKPGYTPPKFDSATSASKAFESLSRIALAHEESEKLSRSEWFSKSAGFPFLAISAAILAISTHARLESEKDTA